ncbi:unnamed protein product [Peronospora belbahrii]|nr:unnamed protein product [Peronospora belbahrii]
MALLAPTALAHQIVLDPPPCWTTNDKDTRYNPLAFLENQGFKTSLTFAGSEAQKTYGTLREFLDKAKYNVAKGANFSSGFTDAEGTPRPIPSKGIFRTTGYTHNGPCAVYLNKKLVLDGEDCHTQYPGKDHIIDYSSCGQKCLLRWYWLGIRQIKDKVSWQVYKAIIPLTAEKPSSKEK